PPTLRASSSSTRTATLAARSTATRPKASTPSRTCASLQEPDDATREDDEPMPILTPTFDDGAMTMPAPMTAVLPDRAITPDMLTAAQERLPGLNVEFLFGQLSMILQHERCGTHLYRSVAARTHNPMLKRKYEELGRETERHVELAEELVSALGGVPLCVAPAARAVEKADAGILETTVLAAGSCDVMTAEAQMLNAVFVAETIDHANW